MIDAKEATTPEGAVSAFLSGRKDVVMISDEEYMGVIGFGRIDVRQERHNIGMHLLYRPTPEGRDKAEKLRIFLSEREGYARDKMPEEARYVGRLFDYTEDSIQRYIDERYDK
jgi:hypothetical protein